MARVLQVRDEGARRSPPDEPPPDGLGIHNPARRNIGRVTALSAST